MKTDPSRRRWWLAPVVALLSLPAGSGALAGGFSNPDFGTRRVGMGAVMARPDDGSAVFHNPAGMVLTEGTELYHHQTWSYIDMGMRLYDSTGALRPDHEVTPDINIGVLPFFGAVSDLGTERLRVGAALYAPNAYGAVMPDDEPTRYHALQVLFLASRLSAAAAWRVSDHMALGVTLSLVHVYLTAKSLMNPMVFQDPDVRFRPVSETRAMDHTLQVDGTDLTWTATVGILLQPMDRLSFGASFTKGAGVDLEGDVTLTQPDGSEVTAHHHTNMTIPFSLRAGLSWQMSRDFELGVDVFYWRYEAFQEQRTVLDRPVMGMTEMVSPKNYHDSWNWCVGLMHHVTEDLDFMLGYQQDYTPIPPETFGLDNPTMDMHGVGTGIRWQVSDGLRVGVALMRNWYDLIDVKTSVTVPPSNAKGHGGNTELGFDVAYTL